MKAYETELPGVIVVEPRVFRDERGYFLETWNDARYREFGVEGPFVQDNLSYSAGGVIRGLHYQEPHAQGKLVSVLRGEVFDVAVDVRRRSPTFGRWVSRTLSAGNALQLYVPPGFAHGFAVTSEEALVLYKCTDRYDPAAETTVVWDDPQIGIDWPLAEPILSAKDRAGLLLDDVPGQRLPRYDSQVERGLDRSAIFRAPSRNPI